MFNVWDELINEREKNGLSLNELSKISDLPLPELIKLESGQEEVNEDQLEALAEALNISPIILLGMEPTIDDTNLETRFRINGNKDVDIEKAFQFGIDFINKIDELKYLNSID
ncbi:helix-turn-helix domain-containing protein [Cytobacillus sp. FSL H8-0458]|uniref:helix-turn-helix domain-containing protein n=1 Tax=Cytobacillus sp. FSL H8-0458 TaxID=2975346 RepID=UPI0030FC0BCD